MILELRTKEILNKTRTDFASLSLPFSLSFLVIMIFRVMCRWRGRGGGVGGYMEII